MGNQEQPISLRRRRLLALPPDQRLSALLNQPRPAESVRVLPAQDIFLMVLEGGLEQALPLLPLTTREQAVFFFDVDAWKSSCFSPERAGYWIRVFHEASPDLLVRWLNEAEEELVVLTLHRLLQIYKLDESTDQAFWPPERPLSTIDGIYYLEAREGIPEEVFSALFEALTRLRSFDRTAFEGLLEQVLWSVPGELEEEALERRNLRLAERGFPELDEALAVWSPGVHPDQPLAEALRGRLGPTPPPPPATATNLPALLEKPGTEALARAARGLDDPARERLVAHLVRLANRYAVSSLHHLGDPDTHRLALETALCHVNLGLQEITGAQLSDLGPAALSQLSVFELNEAGMAAIMQRVFRARRLAETGWLSRQRLAWKRLDQPLEDMTSGLLAPRPLFQQEGVTRSFTRPDDLTVADSVLATLEAFGFFIETVLSSGGRELPELDVLPLERESPQDMEWSAVILTALARAALEQEPRPKPLDPVEANNALALLLTAEPPRTASDRFFQLTDRLGLNPAAAFLAHRLTHDVGDLSPTVVPDPRLVRALLFSASR